MWILGPVMIGGWMISALAVYFMTGKLGWKECMACAVCFNAIDPILAATVVGKGHFAEKVPLHLQNLMLEVLLGFFAGYTFGWDDWFQRQTEDAGLSITIDMLLNLSYFVFLGAIIPWQSFNVPQLGIVPWRLVAGTLMIFLLRRIPVVLAFARRIPEIKSFREALFYGHFGPIGPGAIFSALVVQATFETGGTRQLGQLLPDLPFNNLSSTVWPIVTFVVPCSSIVHGSSVPVWILGKQINTLPIIMTYSQGSSNGQNGLNRLRRLSIENRGDAIPTWVANIPPGTPPRRQL